MANTEVPADIFPVFTPTLFVAAIPVPASPSGGHTNIPAFSLPEGSKRRTPSSVKLPAASPAINTCGRISSNFHKKPSSRIRLLN